MKKILTGIGLIALIIIALIIIGYASAPNRTNVTESEGYSLGNNNALVTIIEFSDFECPYCGKFYNETLPNIKENYINTGKVRFIYRNFPLTTIHKNSLLAAQAAEAAGEQGKYWEMHDILYSNQNELQLTDLQKYAIDLNLDMQKFNSAIESKKFLGKIQKDTEDGIKAGVSGTPAFFINGIKLVGAQPFSNFEKIIESELAKAK